MKYPGFNQVKLSVIRYLARVVEYQSEIRPPTDFYPFPELGIEIRIPEVIRYSAVSETPSNTFQIRHLELVALQYYCYQLMHRNGVRNRNDSSIIEDQTRKLEQVLLRPRQKYKWPITPSIDLQASFAYEILRNYDNGNENEAWSKLKTAYSDALDYSHSNLLNYLSDRIQKCLNQRNGNFEKLSTTRRTWKIKRKSKEVWPENEIHERVIRILPEFQPSTDLHFYLDPDLLHALAEGVIQLFGPSSVDQIVHHLQPILHFCSNSKNNGINRLRDKLNSQLPGYSQFQEINNKWKLNDAATIDLKYINNNPENELRRRCLGGFNAFRNVPMISDEKLNKLLETIAPHLQQETITASQLAYYITPLFPNNIFCETVNWSSDYEGTIAGSAQIELEFGRNLMLKSRESITLIRDRPRIVPIKNMEQTDLISTGQFQDQYHCKYQTHLQDIRKHLEHWITELNFLSYLSVKDRWLTLCVIVFTVRNKKDTDSHIRQWHNQYDDMPRGWRLERNISRMKSHTKTFKTTELPHFVEQLGEASDERLYLYMVFWETCERLYNNWALLSQIANQKKGNDYEKF